MTSQDSATAPTRYLLAEKLRELRGKYKSDKPWVSPVPCERCGRINQLAEACMISFDTLGDYYMRVGEYLAYIHAADIILESLE